MPPSSSSAGRHNAAAAKAQYRNASCYPAAVPASEEVRLFYVAMTRARKRLVIDSNTLEFFQTGAWKKFVGDSSSQAPKNNQNRGNVQHRSSISNPAAPPQPALAKHQEPSPAGAAKRAVLPTPDLRPLPETTGSGATSKRGSQSTNDGPHGPQDQSSQNTDPALQEWIQRLFNR